MLKSRQYTPQFDALEGKVLLSTGMSRPAAHHRQMPKHVTLNGTLHGLPSGSAGLHGYSVTSFLVSGRLGALKNVTGAFTLADKIIPLGKLPDLSNASLFVANKNASVLVRILPAKKNHYHFKIVGGAGNDAGAFGAGTIKIVSTRNSFGFDIKLHSGG